MMEVIVCTPPPSSPGGGVEGRLNLDKKNLKIGLFNYKKVYKQERFALS